MLHSLPRLIWKISIAPGRSFASKSGTPVRCRTCSCCAAEASGDARETSEVVARGPASLSISGAPTAFLGHHLLVHVLQHLHAMDQRGAAADRRGDVQGLGHLLE